MNLGDSIRHGAKWLLAGNAAAQILQFAFGIVLARLLVPADFGVLVTIRIFTGLAGFISGGGMGQALIRAKQADHEDFQVVFTIQIIFGLLIYATFFVTAPLFAHWYSEPLYTELFRVSALSFVLRPFSNVPNAWLSREMRFKQRMSINLACATIGSMVSVTLAWHKFGVWSLIFGGITGTVLSAIALMILTPIRPGIRFNAAVATRLGLYGFKVTSNELAVYIRNQTPNFFLSQLQGPTAVGLFNKADSLAKTPRMITWSAYDPLFRSLAKISDNKDQSQYVYLRIVTLLTVYMLPFFVGLAWLATPLIHALYGAKWLPSGEPLTILSMAGLFACIGNPAGAVLAAQNWLGREIFVQLTLIVLFAASSVIGIHWGLTGVAWGLLLSEGIYVVLMAHLVNRCLNSQFGRLAKCLMPGILLNLLLCGALLLANFLFPDNLRETQPMVYSIIMFGVGVTVYASAFLFVPIPALASEVSRWKERAREIFAGR